MLPLCQVFVFIRFEPNRASLHTVWPDLDLEWPWPISFFNVCIVLPSCAAWTANHSFKKCLLTGFFSKSKQPCGITLFYYRLLNSIWGLAVEIVFSVQDDSVLWCSILLKIPRGLIPTSPHDGDITNSSQINSQEPTDHQSAWQCVLDKTWNVATQTKISQMNSFNRFIFLIIYLDEWQPLQISMTW